MKAVDVIHFAKKKLGQASLRGLVSETQICDLGNFP